MERTYIDLASNPIASPTKIKILEAAIELFSKRGFSGASVRDITNEVGIKESSLYKHFKNKDEILETIFAFFRKEADKILPPMEHLDFIAEKMNLVEFLERGMQNFKRHLDDEINQKIWRIMYIELFRHPMAKDIYRNGIVKRTVDCLEVVFAKMIERGKMVTRDPKRLAIEYQYPLYPIIVEYNLLMSEGKSTEEIDAQVIEHIRYFADQCGVTS
ncbi:TetR/AcrR family transcriptional regulator [Paenibacillus antri]|uniref:TetR/AcrR family transcriptional regulator n=1 Tax=Paenibacillus antri TaxID=2582848 RepID=A0A5R9GIE4_9BACL|nr:TetR/AcrR family transcriptional regulator [Paenibacillus antri]TLS53194.1 TetR/AcrR family transcriptional regulator [Paenibacillus antri]